MPRRLASRDRRLVGGSATLFRRRCASLAGLLVVCAACRSGAGRPGPEPPAARALPEAGPPFVAGPLTPGDGYLRRAYAKGDVRIELTIAERKVRPDEYEQWIVQARDYPQAVLALPASEASGFYTCAGDGGPRVACDLHIQLRAGYHIEVMGGGRATRADVDQLMARIPLGALAGAAR
jgi:hypothetical protein